MCNSYEATSRKKKVRKNDDSFPFFKQYVVRGKIR